MSTDFTGQLDFAFGDVRGIRLWVLQEDQGEIKLRSAVRSWFWKPGVNEAGCTASETRLQRPDCIAYHEHGPDWPLSRIADECYSQHIPGIDPRHQCGFYAYSYTKENTYQRVADGSGMMEDAGMGVGEVTMS